MFLSSTFCNSSEIEVEAGFSAAGNDFELGMAPVSGIPSNRSRTWSVSLWEEICAREQIIAKFKFRAGISAGISWNFRFDS